MLRLAYVLCLGFKLKKMYKMCIKKSVNKIFLIFKHSCVNFVILKSVVDLDYFLQDFRDDSVKQLFKTVLLQCLCKILLKLSPHVGCAYKQHQALLFNCILQSSQF